MSNPVCNVYSLDEMLSLIQREQPFAGSLESAGCYIKVDNYLPVVCTAIHAGSRLREDLLKQCQLSQAERHLEEAPYTDQFIAAFRIRSQSRQNPQHSLQIRLESPTER